MTATQITSQTTTAAAHAAFGDADRAIRIGSVPTPAPAAGQVLVKVEAAGISIGDWLVMQGLPYIARPAHGLLSPKHPVLGQELAGTVVAVGADAGDAFAPGDRVLGFAQGAFAGYALASPEDLTHTPESLDSIAAAAVPISGLAAYQAVVKAGGGTAGQRLLVLGASGAVGTYAVQVGKAIGMHVTAVAGARSQALLSGIGADEVVDYRAADIAVSGETWDVIVDLAGNRGIGSLRRLLAPTGTAVLVGGSGGRVFMGFGRTIRAMLANSFVKQTLVPLFSAPDAEDLAALRALVAAGSVVPVIDRTFPLEDLARAMEHIGGRHTQGKSVIVLDD